MALSSAGYMQDIYDRAKMYVVTHKEILLSSSEHQCHVTLFLFLTLPTYPCIATIPPEQLIGLA